jgi:superfamily II DNA or RNA helicase
MMLIPHKIIDNSEGKKLVIFLKQILKAAPESKLDIATAFFNIQAYTMVKDELNGVPHFRLLLGKAPEIGNERTLGDALLEELQKEVEGFELSKEKEGDVKSLIEFLRRKSVEVKLYEKDFLHGKAYIFDNIVIIGSSNFTAAGLTHNTELNSVGLESEAVYTRKEWFEKFWADAEDFKDQLIKLLEDSRFGTTAYTPYQLYIKVLYELQKQDIRKEEEKPKGLPESKVELTEFQEDAVGRVFSRLQKYRCILVADSVGLGKTWIAKKVIEEFGFYRRKRFLVICPAQLRGMWSKETKNLILTESVLSQEELASEDFLKKAKETIGGDLTDIGLIVVDESHNFRNPLSNRWENLFTLVKDNISKGGKRPYILFLTATPINNTIWDLYWQIMLLVTMDRQAFVKENIVDLFQFFKIAEKKDNPALLNDLLNEISIRRTRDYIKRNYPDATVNGKKVIFPERRLENMTYKLGATYKGMYKTISHALTEELTMAYYRLLEYKRAEKLSPDEGFALGRMIALEGIFRTIMLKRLESSVEAFRKSVFKHIAFLRQLKEHLKQGRLLTKKAFNQYLMSVDEELEDYIETLDVFKPEEYDMDRLFAAIDKDITVSEGILAKVKVIRPEDDAKLLEFKKRLHELAAKGQIIVFTYYADTLDYIHEQVSKSADFANLKIEKISGATPPSKREDLVNDFLAKKIGVLMSTDVLSEGMNLQSAQFVINYDLHWNPTRMIQRAGRIDRIGSPYKQIFVYNFFPEDELEELLRLVHILQSKIIDIDESVGLDQTILGETIHPKVFGVIRRILKKDATIFEELETSAFGGGEKFYQPLKDFQKQRAIEELDQIPFGIHSGLQSQKLRAIFFYYKYGQDSHFWCLVDPRSGEIISRNKSEIVDYLACPTNEPRVIPDFFDAVYEANKKALEDIQTTYKKMEQVQGVDTTLVDYSKEQSTKFVKDLLREIEIQLEEYLDEFPAEKNLESRWEVIRTKMLGIPLTKRRLRDIRRIWRHYKNGKDWKKLIDELDQFLAQKGLQQREPIEPFDSERLKLVAIDFIS